MDGSPIQGGVFKWGPRHPLVQHQGLRRTGLHKPGLTGDPKVHTIRPKGPSSVSGGGVAVVVRGGAKWRLQARSVHGGSALGVGFGV